MGNSSFKEEHTEEETVGLTREHDGQDEEEVNADSSTKTEETQPTEGTSSDLQTSWNILNLIQGKDLASGITVFDCLPCL